MEDEARYPPITDDGEGFPLEWSQSHRLSNDYQHVGRCPWILEKMYKTYQVVSLMSNLTVDNFVIHIIPSQNKIQVHIVIGFYYRGSIGSGLSQGGLGAEQP